MRGVRGPRNVIRMSGDGYRFVKCSYGMADSSVDAGRGIPDMFDGRTVMIKDCNTLTVSAPAGKDTYIVKAPVPGYSIFKQSVAVGAQPTSLVGTVSNTYEQNYGNGSPKQNNYSNFRFASGGIGVYPTMNYMSFNGSISTWKADLHFEDNLITGVTQVDTGEVQTPEYTKETVGGTANVMVSTGELTQAVLTSATYDDSIVQRNVAGLQSINPLPPRDNYTESIIKGMFTVVTNNKSDFEWANFCDADSYVATDGDSSTCALTSDGTHPLKGLGCLQTSVTKITNNSTEDATLIVKEWSCLEMQPNTNSLTYSFSGKSPKYDPIALEMYNVIKDNLPVAVPCAQNSSFWERVLAIMRNVGRVGSFLPGPFGAVGTGIEMISEGLQNVFF